jgi:PAS domain S-box-containing protein
LRRTEKELRDLVENMPAMAGVLLPDGSHPYLTNQWQEYTGLSVAKTDLEGWRRVVHPEDVDLYAQNFRAAAAARKPFDNELRLRRAADGEYRWFLVRISPLCDGRGNIVKWHGVMTDIQDRKRAEEATRRSEKELRDVLEQVPGMVFAVVEDGRYGRYSYVSTQWYDYTGLSEAETINGGWQNAIHSEDTEQHMKKYQIAVAEGQPFESEVRLRRAADGQYRWFLIRVTPLRDEAGNVVKWYGFISDIEDRKRAEQERERLRKLEAELAHMNRVSTMGELTASIAHEINQPLTVVVSNANACARMLSTASPDLDEVRLAVGDIADYGRRASEVLARIRGQLKKSASAKSSLNIGDVIVEVLPLLRGELEKRRTKLDTHLQSNLPLVLGDRIELQQVLINLLMNGIESMSSIMDRPRVLTVQSRIVESGEVEVAVRDCGVGISVNQMRSLFDPFFTTKPGGMGMGLPISRSIIEAHGGKLWASSNASCGATFQFTLPAA